MIRLTSLILIIQGFCLFHAYKYQKEYHLYLLIIFLPIIGSIAYLYIHFATKENIETVSNSIKTTVNSNYEIDRLLRESKYTDTIANRIKLADAYTAKNRYHDAITLYESCLEGYNKDDHNTREKLLVARYFISDYKEVIYHAEHLKNIPSFRNSDSRITYAWSLSHLNHHSMAESEFKAMDIRFSNYTHRIEYSKYLVDQNKQNESKQLLLSIKDELDHMDRNEKRQKKNIARELDKTLRQLNK